MELIQTRALRGPNLWSRNTALEIEVSCSTEECALNSVSGFMETLRGLCPSIGSLDAPGHQGPLTLAHALEATLLALQAQAGCPVSFSCTSATPVTGVYQVVVEYSEEDVGRLALKMAREVIDYVWRASTGTLGANTQAPDVGTMLSELREMDEDLRLGPSTGSIVMAAVARGIPFRRLTQGSLVQLGWGARQRRIQAAEVDSTSAVAESIAQDKDLTKHLLHAAGVPVPMGAPVHNVQEAWEVAQRIGFPVVVKPQNGSQGKGVTVNIQTREQLELAFPSATGKGAVLVEKFFPGSDYRLLVVGDKLVAAARRDPPQVIGDGEHTVRALVDIVNADPRRGDGHATALTKIRFDDIAIACLATQNLTPESVPEKGRRVILRNNANLSTGGSATDVTDDVHPEVAARAIDAAGMIGLHVCGVDIVCENIMRPLEEQNGGVVEVNAAPGLRMHLNPSYGKGRNIGAAVMDLMFHGEDGRIPVVAVSGVNGKTTTTRLISHVLATHGLCVGMTNTDGVYVGGRQTDSGDCSGPKSARNVLSHPHVEAAVLETARGGVLREGLGFDKCAVAVVTNIGEGDHLGLNHMHTPEDVSRIKQIIVQNVAPTGYAVLNAADPLVANMAPHCAGKVIFFAQSAQHPLLVTHRARGNRVVFVEAGHIVAAEGSQQQHRLALSDVPLTRGGLLGFQVENTLAAVGACWALALPWATIVEGVCSFNNDSKNAPGRFNLMHYRDATVVADYGHNPHAMRALVAAFDALPATPSTKRTVVISGAGDRRDEDLRELTRVLGAAFDNIVLFEDACQRGRADGEVIALLREGLEGAKRASHVEEIRGEFIAIDRGLEMLKPGDQCLVLVDQVQEALDHLSQRVAEG